MKLILNLLNYQASKLFGDISDIKSFLDVKLSVLEYLLTFWHGNEDPKPPYLLLETETLHRVFLVNGNGTKIVSFGFEFVPKLERYDLTVESNRILKFNYLGYNGFLTSEEVSQCFTLLSNFDKEKKNLYCYSANYNDELISDSSKYLFEFLLFSEPGYVRYDHDTIGFKRDTHPLDHFDINFSDNVTYKIGTRSDIRVDDFKLLFKSIDSCPEVILRAKEFPCPVKKKRKSKRKQKRKGVRFHEKK